MFIVKCWVCGVNKEGYRKGGGEVKNGFMGEKEFNLDFEGKVDFRRSWVEGIVFWVRERI